MAEQLVVAYSSGVGTFVIAREHHSKLLQRKVATRAVARARKAK